MNETNQKPSRFFPPSAYVFQEAMDLFTAQIKDCDEACEEMQKKLDALAEIKRELMAFWEENSSVITKLDSIIGGISGIYQKDFPLHVQFEREYYKNFPTCTSPEAPTFQKDFLMLVKGLDEESIETVVLALQRIHQIQGSADVFMALYSEEEKRIMRQRAEHFYTNVLKISEDCYFYRGYLLPVNHFEPCVFADWCGLSWLEHPERLADADMIDAGAFIGDSALVFSSMTKGNIHAFEPVPDSYNLMLKTIEMNGISNVIPCLSALGESRGRVTLAVNDSGSTQFENEAFQYESSVDANVISVDEYVKEHNLQIGLIKADVEGAEQLMLRGAAETIRAQKPALLISIYHNSGDFFKIKPMIEAMDLGYRFKIRHPIFGSVLTETILIAEIP